MNDTKKNNNNNIVSEQKQWVNNEERKNRFSLIFVCAVFEPHRVRHIHQECATAHGTCICIKYTFFSSSSSLFYFEYFEHEREEKNYITFTENRRIDMNMLLSSDI